MKIKSFGLAAVTAAAVVFGGFAVTPASAKTLKMAYDADPVSLDPHEQLSGGTLQLSHMVFDPLVRWARDMSFEPRLAERWEQIDAKTTRFHLRKGVRFHSGNAFTANDVKWTVDRLKASPDFKGLLDPFEGAKVVDESHRRPDHQEALRLGDGHGHLHLPDGFQVLHGQGRARQGQGRGRQARRLLRVQQCVRHRSVPRHLS